MTAALLDIHGLRQSFPRADGDEHLVLDGVELALNQGQIVGLLGPHRLGQIDFAAADRGARRSRPAAPSPISASR